MDQLAETLEAVASTVSRRRKVRLMAAWLESLDDEDLARGLRFLSGQAVNSAAKKFSIGYAALREAAAAATGWDRDLIRLCHREVGDSGETISLLLRGIACEQALSLEAAEAAYLSVFRERSAQGKVEKLREVLVSMKPLTAKYFIKVITGNFRVGLQLKLVEEALALATQTDLNELRAAINRSGDLVEVARSARRGQLANVRAKLFHPMEFMLAKPLEVAGVLDPQARYFVEDKFDGIRSQIHFDSGKVRIYTRGAEDATAAFPELCEAFTPLSGSGVLDGEVLAWRDGKALNFAVLQQRIARKRVDGELRARIPVAFVAYDLLVRDGRLLLEDQLEVRRQALEDLAQHFRPPLLLSPQEELCGSEEIDTRFTAARQRGNEGLMLKQAGTPYEAGKRSANWWKVKRPYATLDVVVTAAEQGTGRRATMLSDYTFAVREGERFLNIGKAYSGLTDEEIRALTRLFRSIALERFGRVTLVKPEVVLEVAFDGIQKSPRHKSGYALRFPRIVRWRTDKQASDADSLDRVKELYASTLEE